MFHRGGERQLRHTKLTGERWVVCVTRVREATTDGDGAELQQTVYLMTLKKSWEVLSAGKGPLTTGM